MSVLRVADKVRRLRMFYVPNQSNSKHALNYQHSAIFEFRDYLIALLFTAKDAIYGVTPLLPSAHEERNCLSQPISHVAIDRC